LLCLSDIIGAAEVGRLHTCILMTHSKHEHPGGVDHPQVVLHLSLDGLLPANQVLAVKSSLQTVTLLAITADEEPHILEQQHFSPNGMCVLVPLLEAYPHYCPYEVLLASLFSQTPEQSRAQMQSDWNSTIRPVRRAMNSLVPGLRTFGLQVRSIRSAGYLIEALSTSRPGRTP
jgi:hypothetical protein